MCRMILGIGEVDMNILVQGIIDMANDNNAKHERNKDQIFKHGDGWGIAYTKDNKTYLKKSTGEVYSKKNDAKKYQKINPNFCIIHARKKSVGETSTLNCHPFIKQLDNEKFVFCHNGTVQEGFDIGKFKTKGTTDSEKLFLTILNKIRTLQKEKKLKTINDEIIISTIRQALDKVVTRKGTNIFL